MGQKIIVNGRVKQLPRVFRNEEELMEFLKEVVERVSENPEKYFMKNGRWKSNVRIKNLDLHELGIHVEGIEKITLKFSREGDYYVLKTAYPTQGKAIYQYESWSGRWVING
uniref:Uncharacterized protein n=2 Tax=Thermococcus aciditolerans TaxID=2598455 RepID=A0A5C0SQ20_9EURY|nr:hypothetical protein FPV09_04510 [Thermococcus aciditolerans]